MKTSHFLIYIARDKKLLGVIGILDPIRPKMNGSCRSQDKNIGDKSPTDLFPAGLLLVFCCTV